MARLDVKKLAGLLGRMKIKRHPDQWRGRLGSWRVASTQLETTAGVADIGYENTGEPGRVGMPVRPEPQPLGKEAYQLDSEREMKIKGAGKEGPEKIA